MKTREQQYLPDAVARQFKNEHVQKRAVAKRQQRFWRIRRNRPESRAVAAAQNSSLSDHYSLTSPDA